MKERERRVLLTSLPSISTEVLQKLTFDLKVNAPLAVPFDYSRLPTQVPAYIEVNGSLISIYERKTRVLLKLANKAVGKEEEEINKPISIYIQWSSGSTYNNMGRPPCCDKLGVKKGPWTPEEDITLVSYIQDHGPGNWRAIPTTTGLKRCSKSCRLRWTNYLRPGIKRGNFTDYEEKLIIHLQALLGNRWAAIAAYLPERTDNDIKNYWNTHLRKKISKAQELSNYESNSKGQWERRLQTDINMAKQALSDALSLEKPICDSTESKNSSGYSSAIYASSAENISKLLKGWVKKCSVSNTSDQACSASSTGGTTTTTSFATNLLPEASETSLFYGESKPSIEVSTPFSMLETWLFDESTVDQQLGQDDLLDVSLVDTYHDLF
ncbi:hypothetical protein J5N97_006910 [Dioscorea zingiberensis]|uniref:Uncharacterized protein n=1 Tax=Dioscorea zingiberensis TaxID=325984 RepID=A0A9D5DC85_9LILI|nr:hypothetical protein J5N97_006910 [Dioscorea zingiberensis]